MERHDELRRLCAQMHEDDGTRPERDSEDLSARKASRKDAQLCKQALRALDLHIASAAWAIDMGLRVDSVEPAPDATRLRVLVRWSPPLERSAALALLQSRRGELRAAVGGAITRKRVPQLVFEAGPAEEGPHG
jgi:hypothetical protein